MKFEDIFAADKKREDGAWVTEGFRDLPGIQLKVRGDGCAAHVRKVREIFDAATEEERKAPGFQERVDKHVMLDVLLVDWRLKDRPYDRESAQAALETATFRQAIEYASRVVASRGLSTLEDDTKNS